VEPSTPRKRENYLSRDSIFSSRMESSHSGVKEGDGRVRTISLEKNLKPPRGDTMFRAHPRELVSEHVILVMLTFGARRRRKLLKIIIGGRKTTGGSFLACKVNPAFNPGVEELGNQ